MCTLYFPTCPPNDILVSLKHLYTFLQRLLQVLVHFGPPLAYYALHNFCRRKFFHFQLGNGGAVLADPVIAHSSLPSLCQMQNNVIPCCCCVVVKAAYCPFPCCPECYCQSKTQAISILFLSRLMMVHLKMQSRAIYSLYSLVRRDYSMLFLLNISGHE